jgi:hypothetical protein
MTLARVLQTRSADRLADAIVAGFTATSVMMIAFFFGYGASLILAKIQFINA